MANPYIGEIRMFGGNFAPAGWALCEGQLLPISENDALFALIGTIYGGDGQSTFRLPDLRGRIPIHAGNSFPSIGQMTGTESVTLTTNQLPPHSHLLATSKVPASQTTPVNNVAGDTTLAPTAKIYADLSAPTPLAASAVGSTGSTQPHDNRMPYLAVNFIISLFGIFPSQS